MPAGSRFNPVFASLPTTVFETMSRLARQHAAVNLGQGFPDDPGPEDVRRKAAEAVLDGYNQYPPMLGLPALREAVAAHYARFHDLALDPDREVMITSGATEALAGALLALLRPGDEVVLFQPLYDAYRPLVERAGGVPRYVRLAPPTWEIEEAALEAAFSPRTRVVLLNTPLNPAGTLFDQASLERLAAACVRHDAVLVSDEVWEHTVTHGEPHRPAMSLPGLRERTVKIGSAGKIFSLTGWKVGFVVAAPALMAGLAGAHQFLTFTTPPNLQAAVAHGLAKEDGYFEGMRARLAGQRARLARGLERLGYAVLPGRATYFLNVDLEASGIEGGDEAFCLDLVERQGVAAIPVSAFYAEDPVTSVIRFCFAKADATLDEALRRMGPAPGRG